MLSIRSPTIYHTCRYSWIQLVGWRGIQNCAQVLRVDVGDVIKKEMEASLTVARAETRIVRLDRRTGGLCRCGA